MVGGQSIVFHRYHEAGKTSIQRLKYNKNIKDFVKLPLGQIVKKIVGLDCNALYLHALSQDMPTGKAEHEIIDDIKREKEIIEEAKNGKFWGFVECDAEVPEELYDYFQEFQPIVKTVEIEETAENIGKYMFDLIKKIRGKTAKSSRRLILSYHATKILLYVPLLLWYLEKGLNITKVYSAIHLKKYIVYKGFADFIAERRRDADSAKTDDIDDISRNAFEASALMYKNIGNSCIGKTMIDKSKQTTTKFLNEKKFNKAVQSFRFKDAEELKNTNGNQTDYKYEVGMYKKRNKWDNCIQVGIAVYQLAKLCVLKFVYDFIDKYIPRECYQLMESDTDSLYIAFSNENMDLLVKPKLLEEYKIVKDTFLPRTDTKEHNNYDNRTPGLFKEEARGDIMVCLCSKLYFLKSFDDSQKSHYANKGVNKNCNTDKLNIETFKKVLDSATPEMVKNNSIIYCGKKMNMTENNELLLLHRMVNITQEKKGLTPIYIKKRIDADGITCFPTFM